MALTTLAGYKAAVEASGYDATTPAVLLDAINEARREIASERRWSWLEVVGNTTMALAYDTPSEALSGITDLERVDAVRLEIGTTYVELDYLLPQRLRDKEHIDRTPGLPCYWTEAAGQLRFYPSPDQAYTVSVDYIKTITDLAVDADPDEFIPVSFKPLVKWKAAELLAFRQRDYWSEDRARAKYGEALRRREGRESVRQRQTAQQVVSNPNRFR